MNVESKQSDLNNDNRWKSGNDVNYALYNLLRRWVRLWMSRFFLIFFLIYSLFFFKDWRFKKGFRGTRTGTWGWYSFQEYLCLNLNTNPTEIQYNRQLTRNLIHIFFSNFKKYIFKYFPGIYKLAKNKIKRATYRKETYAFDVGDNIVKCGHFSFEIVEYELAGIFNISRKSFK